MASGPVSFQSIQKKYLESVLQGNKTGATELIDRCLGSGATVAQIYLHVFQPVQRQIGLLWSQKEIGIADEHLASQITLEQMDRIRPSIQPPHRLHRRVVVTTVQGDTHWIGARMIADLFLADGWDVDFLGADTPVEALVSFVKKSRPDLAALSVTFPRHLENLAVTTLALKKIEPPLPVLAGGLAFSGMSAKKAREEYHLDALGTDTTAALETARRLAGLDQPGYSLENYLTRLGEKIQLERKRLGWSQEQLAREAEMDRTYISSVERGRQNLTISALLKISSALHVPPEDLMGEGTGIT